jgi:hypothetical protein
VTCIYCLARESLYGRRCVPCHAYLDSLRTSDSPRDRDYCTQLIDLAVDRYMRRESKHVRVTLLRAA